MLMAKVVGIYCSLFALSVLLLWFGIICSETFCLWLGVLVGSALAFWRSDEGRYPS